MGYRKVLFDLRRIDKADPDVWGVQEFKYPWYWGAAVRALRQVQKYPKFWLGDRTSQPVFWKRNLWKRQDATTRKLHDGVKKVTEDRFINGVLLKDRKTGLCAWYNSAHYVVGGDQPGDSELRKRLLKQDKAVTRKQLEEQVATGFPVFLTVDANCRGKFLGDEIGGQKVHYVGTPGIEYIIYINGKNGTEVDPKNHFDIPTSQLNTDHETRVFQYSLVQELDA